MVEYPYIGEIMFTTSPSEHAEAVWLPCDGRQLSVSLYSALFSVIGKKYGGDGVSNFRLPDFRGRMLLGAGAGTGLSPRTVGQVGGQEQIQIEARHLPKTFPLEQIPGPRGLAYWDVKDLGADAATKSVVGTTQITEKRAETKFGAAPSGTLARVGSSKFTFTARSAFSEVYANGSSATAVAKDPVSRVPGVAASGTALYADTPTHNMSNLMAHTKLDLEVKYQEPAYELTIPAKIEKSWLLSSTEPPVAEKSTTIVLPPQTARKSVLVQASAMSAKTDSPNMGNSGGSRMLPVELPPTLCVADAGRAGLATMPPFAAVAAWICSQGLTPTRE